MESARATAHMATTAAARPVVDVVLASAAEEPEQKVHRLAVKAADRGDRAGTGGSGSDRRFSAWGRFRRRQVVRPPVVGPGRSSRERPWPSMTPSMTAVSTTTATVQASAPPDSTGGQAIAAASTIGIRNGI